MKQLVWKNSLKHAVAVVEHGERDFLPSLMNAFFIQKLVEVMSSKKCYLFHQSLQFFVEKKKQEKRLELWFYPHIESLNWSLVLSTILACSFQQSRTHFIKVLIVKFRGFVALQESVKIAIQNTILMELSILVIYVMNSWKPNNQSL